MDIEQLIKALDNDSNQNILNETMSSIKSKKNDILQQIGFSGEKLKDLHKKLKFYKLCESIDDIDFGRYVRWFSLKNPDNIKLTNGGIICDMKNINNELHLICRNNCNRFIQLNFSQCIVFQKLSNDENIILHALKMLE